MTTTAMWREGQTVTVDHPTTVGLTFVIERVKQTKAIVRSADAVTLTAHIGPGDDLEPVLTLLMPGED